MTPLTVPELPERSGAYRWLYADAQAGEWTVVCILMVGAVFSPRYLRRGAAPLAHTAVNVALYRGGRRRAWAFSEYTGAERTAERLRIGRSSIVYPPDGRVQVAIEEVGSPWGRPIRLQLDLEPLAPPSAVLRLSADRPHFWQLLAPRARAWLSIDGDPAQEGLGYHDSNWGEEPLGEGVDRWRWTRIHDGEGTRVSLRPEGEPSFEVDVRDGRVRVRRGTPLPPPTRRSFWGLQLPIALGAGEGLIAPPPRTLESAPFYARLERRAEGYEALSEVADFRRFRSPWFSWMARLRSRRAGP